MSRQAALVTGFEPYGGMRINPSAEVANVLDGTEVAGVPVVGHVLPVSFALLRENIGKILSDLEPRIVVNLGLAPGVPTIRLERFAVNLADFEIPDNAGELLRDAPLDAASPLAFPSRLPLRAIERALLDAGIPAQLSNSAGTFLCNATMYTVLRESGIGKTVPCGFVHLPYVPAQVAELLRRTHEAHLPEAHARADWPSMSLATMIEAVRIILATSLAAPGGAQA